jgi:hypothetical protein
MKKLISTCLLALLIFSGCNKQSKEELEILENIEWHKSQISQKQVYDVEIYRYDDKLKKNILIGKGKSTELIIKDLTLEFRGNIFELRYLNQTAFEYLSNASPIFSRAELYFDR